MKVFLLKVGRKTRGGGFQELHSQVVSVSDENQQYQVEDYFKPRYKGFEVTVERVETVDISENLPQANRYNAEKKHGCLTNFEVKYTSSEKEMFDEYRNLLSKAQDKLNWLEAGIKDRYGKLFYVDNSRMYMMKLHTDHNGTVCEALPIQSAEFFNVVKKCVDGSEPVEENFLPDDTEIAESNEELVTEPPMPGDEDIDTDIPF